MFLVGFLPCDAMCIDVTKRNFSFNSKHNLSNSSFTGNNHCNIPCFKEIGKHWGYASFFIGILSMALGPIMLSGVFG